jgi:transcriptional regulator with XRE-family HTH domain
VKQPPKRNYYRDDAFLKGLGQKVREERIRKGLTQTELAFKCRDIDYSQINRIELGKVNFSVSFLNLLAEALEVKAVDLMP